MKRIIKPYEVSFLLIIDENDMPKVKQVNVAKFEKELIIKLFFAGAKEVYSWNLTILEKFDNVGQKTVIKYESPLFNEILNKFELEYKYNVKAYQMAKEITVKENLYARIKKKFPNKNANYLMKYNDDFGGLTPFDSLKPIKYVELYTGYPDEIEEVLEYLEIVVIMDFQ